MKFSAILLASLSVSTSAFTTIPSSTRRPTTSVSVSKESSALKSDNIAADFENTSPNDVLSSSNGAKAGQAEVVLVGCGAPNRGMGWYHAIQMLEGRYVVFVSSCCVCCIFVQFLLIVDIMCIFFVGCGYVYLLVVQLDGWRDISYVLIDVGRSIGYRCDVLRCIILVEGHRGELITSYASNITHISYFSNLSLPPTQTTAAHQHHSIISSNHGS